ncbi:hypothetical protein ACQPYK_25020 [Streptosporangium sp. CA-135522]|uniref:hypothetical protein n=1 Tax=Streptosporangium sp. CA-135522 TaxID=3240072 RepID=UPI003D8A50FB
MTGMLIGATFGAIFVFINASAPLNAALGILLRVAAALALAGVIAMWLQAIRQARATGVEPALPGAAQGATMFGRGFLLVAVIEAVALFGGIAVLGAWQQPEQVNVAWVAFVVGVHFVALAPVWKSRAIAVPGAVLTVLGIAGFVMAATAALDWVPFVSGVLSGATLLAGSLVSARNGLASQNEQASVTR